MRMYILEKTMKVIGLCGGSGSGKGEVSRLFAEHGFALVDTDGIYRDMTTNDSECLSALGLEFGMDIILPNGALDRKMLASLVFCGDGAEKRRARLNEIAHKFILDEARRRLREYESSGVRATVVDAPLLFESGFDKECDIIVCVNADRMIRLDRIMSRDGIDKTTAERRIDSQLSDEKLRQLSDYEIVNNGDVEHLRSEVSRIAKKILVGGI